MQIYIYNAFSNAYNKIVHLQHTLAHLYLPCNKLKFSYATTPVRTIVPSLNAFNHPACLRRSSALAALFATITTSLKCCFRAATKVALPARAVECCRATMALCLSTRSIKGSPWICSRLGLTLTITSRSSRSSISGTLGDDVPFLRVFGATAFANPCCRSLAWKSRDTAAESAAEVDKAVDRMLVVFR